MLLESLRIGAAVLVTVVVAASPAWGKEATPVAPPARELVILGQYAPISGAFMTSESYYREKGTAYALSASYLTRMRPWFQWGGRVGYGRTDYMVSDELFIGGQFRLSVAPIESPRLELGLSLSVGVLTQVISDEPEHGNKAHDHFFTGPTVIAGPELRYWMTPAVALTLGGEASLGNVYDVTQNSHPTTYLNGSMVVIRYAGTAGVVFAL